MTKTILEVPAGEFKARCLKLMDGVRDRAILEYAAEGHVRALPC